MLAGWDPGASAAGSKTQGCVILLHGLARTERTMRRLEKALRVGGCEVANEGYKSRSQSIELLAAPAVESGLRVCNWRPAQKICRPSLGTVDFSLGVIAASGAKTRLILLIAESVM